LAGRAENTGKYEFLQTKNFRLKPDHDGALPRKNLHHRGTETQRRSKAFMPGFKPRKKILLHGLLCVSVPLWQPGDNFFAPSIPAGPSTANFYLIFHNDYATFVTP
jgi:hypothetical protein